MYESLRFLHRLMSWRKFNSRAAGCLIANIKPRISAYFQRLPSRVNIRYYLLIAILISFMKALVSSNIKVELFPSLIWFGWLNCASACLGVGLSTQITLLSIST